MNAVLQRLIEIANEPFAPTNIVAIALIGVFYIMYRHQTKRLYQMHVVLVDLANQIVKNNNQISGL